MSSITNISKLHNGMHRHEVHKLSNHHQRQKRTVLKTLVDQVKRICEPRYLDEELWHLEQLLQANGYSVGEVRRAVRPQETVGFVVLPTSMGWWTVLAGCWRPSMYTVVQCALLVQRSVHQHHEVQRLHPHGWTQPENSAVAEHALFNADHHVLFEETKIFSLESAYYPWLHMEIFKHGCIMINRRGESLLLNSIWHTVVPNQLHSTWCCFPA